MKLTNMTPNGVNHKSEDDWSDQEVLLLLEGVELYDDDWTAIEEHVGSRSAQQCIKKFLQLPIEDPYVATEGSMGPLRFGRVPFEQADNPVMSVVAFLAGVVGPGIAAEAAKTALHALTDGDKKEELTKEEEKDEKEKEKEASSGGEKENDKAEEKAEDRMDEDAPKATTSAQPEASTSSEHVENGPAPSESMVVDVDSSTAHTSQKPTAAIPHSKVVRAATLALKSSAKAASALADAEDLQIRSTLASLIKLTLTKLEYKMSQFEELEELLEEERKSLESARTALINERLGLKRMLDNVRGELAKNAGAVGPSVLAASSQAQEALTANQGARVTEVQNTVSLEGDMGPVSGGNVAQLS